MHGEGSRGRRVDTMGEGQVPGVGALSLKGVKAIGRMKDRPTNRHTNTENSASADGGPRSRVCARETLCSTPINTSGNFRRTCLQSNLQNFQKKPIKTLKVGVRILFFYQNFYLY
jgi:hypothetical protein